jgi:hypothetical protein
VRRSVTRRRCARASLGPLLLRLPHVNVLSVRLRAQVVLAVFFEQQISRDDFLPLLRRQHGGRFRADLSAVEVSRRPL